MTRLVHHDFLDFGASKGGCIDFAKARLGGKRGLGVDTDATKVERMRQLGYECIQADATSAVWPRNSVRFVTMSHFLEHLPDLNAVHRAIACAADAASDFLFIQGPYFDADVLLMERGLKFFWSDWHGHTCHLSTKHLQAALVALRIEQYLIMGRVLVIDSLDPSIHPIDSPRDQHEYISGTHPPKEFVAFNPPLYREMVCFIRLRPIPNWNNIVQARRGCHLIDGTLQF